MVVINSVTYSVNLLKECFSLNCHFNRRLRDFKAMLIVPENFPGNTIKSKPAFLYLHYARLETHHWL